MSHGIRSVLSTPLIVNGSVRSGCSTSTPATAHAFSDVDRQLALLLAGQATIAITAALRHYDEITLSDHLRTALSSRSVIDQAIGILMAQQRCGPDEAFALLRAVSQRTTSSSARWRQIWSTPFKPRRDRGPTQCVDRGEGDIRSDAGDGWSAVRRGRNVPVGVGCPRATRAPFTRVTDEVAARGLRRCVQVKAAVQTGHGQNVSDMGAGGPSPASAPRPPGNGPLARQITFTPAAPRNCTPDESMLSCR